MAFVCSVPQLFVWLVYATPLCGGATREWTQCVTHWDLLLSNASIDEHMRMHAEYTSAIYNLLHMAVVFHVPFGMHAYAVCSHTHYSLHCTVLRCVDNTSVHSSTTQIVLGHLPPLLSTV